MYLLQARFDVKQRRIPTRVSILTLLFEFADVLAHELAVALRPTFTH
jgi:hypothetical protein